MSEPPVNRESELIEQIRAIDVPAPERLHRRTEELIAAHRAPRDRDRGYALRPRLGAAVGLAGALVLALVLVLGSGGGGSTFSLRDASALAVAPATRTAPAESATRRTQLAAAVDGVAFPYWGERFGWRSTGSRRDRLDGRGVTTVFYSGPGGGRIGYAIVAGAPAPQLAGGTMHWRAGIPYRLTRIGGRLVVAWKRGGRLCILTGRGVSVATLLMLASWHERGTAA